MKCREIINLVTFCSTALHSSQPLLRIFHFREAGIGVFPEVEEFLIVLDGFGFIALLLVDFAQHIEGFGVYVAVI